MRCQTGTIVRENGRERRVNGRAEESESEGARAEEQLCEGSAELVETSSSTGSHGADAAADGKGDHRGAEGKRKSPRVHSLTPAPYRKRNWSADWARLRHRQAKSPSESRCGLVAPYPFRGTGESQPALPCPSSAAEAAATRRKAAA